MSDPFSAHPIVIDWTKIQHSLRRIAEDYLEDEPEYYPDDDLEKEEYLMCDFYDDDDL
jgi:hypothetical protein